MPRHDPLAESSLPKCREWDAWLRYHLDTLPNDTGLERLLRDTLIVVHHNVANCARRLRGNPGWDIQGSMRDDTIRLEDEARENLAHWKNHRPKYAPAKLEKLFDCLEGALAQQVRLAREIDELQTTGKIDLAVTTDGATGNLIERKFS